MSINVETIRYFRNCNPATYCTLQGDCVTYFAPHVPNGFVSEDITRAVVLRYAEKQPHLDGEINLEDVEKIRKAWDDQAAADAKAHRRYLIAEWWGEYGRVLRREMNAAGSLDKLNEITRRCEAAGVVVLGCPMPRDGAEAMARECDELLKDRRRHWAKS